MDKYPSDITELKKQREKSLKIVDSLKGEALAQELAHLHNLEICISILESKIPLNSHPRRRNRNGLLPST